MHSKKVNSSKHPFQKAQNSSVHTTDFPARLGIMPQRRLRKALTAPLTLPQPSLLNALPSPVRCLEGFVRGTEFRDFTANSTLLTVRLLSGWRCGNMSQLQKLKSGSQKRKEKKEREKKLKQRSQVLTSFFTKKGEHKRLTTR